MKRLIATIACVLLAACSGGSKSAAGCSAALPHANAVRAGNQKLLSGGQADTTADFMALLDLSKSKSTDAKVRSALNAYTKAQVGLEAVVQTHDGGAAALITAGDNWTAADKRLSSTCGWKVS